jgi:diguanylate cyclase (GGDEF)-like protein
MSPVVPSPLPFPKRWPWLALGLASGIAALSVITVLHGREQTAERAEGQATLFANELRDTVREVTVFGASVPERNLPKALGPVIRSTAATAGQRLDRLQATLGDDDDRLAELRLQLDAVRLAAASDRDPQAYASRLTRKADRMAATADAIAADQHARATLTAREALAGAAVAVLAGMTLLALALQRAHRLLVVAGRRQAAQLQELADRDPLTGLANRRRLSEDLSRLAARVADDAPVQVMICDLDGFKNLNDTLGHDAGDELLVAFGRRLAAVAADAGQAYRLGGDEFCVLSRPGLDVAPSVRRAVAGADDPSDPVRGSCGVALWPTEAATAREAMRLADARMYAAKRTPGRADAAETYNKLQGVRDRAQERGRLARAHDPRVGRQRQRAVAHRQRRRVAGLDDRRPRAHAFQARDGERRSALRRARQRARGDLLCDGVQFGGDRRRVLGVGVDDDRDRALQHDAHVGARVVLELGVDVGAVDARVGLQRAARGGRDGAERRAREVARDRHLEVRDRRLRLGDPAGERALRRGRLDRLQRALGARGRGARLDAHSLSSK